MRARDFWPAVAVADYFSGGDSLARQGRRIPSLSSVRTRSMCCLLVSGFLTEITQQIHSLRASGVMSSHCARATGSEMSTFRKSAGTRCTAPGEIAFLVMDFILQRYAISLGSRALEYSSSSNVAFIRTRTEQAVPSFVDWRTKTDVEHFTKLLPL